MPRTSKVETKPEGEEDEFMSLRQVTDLMQQQKDMFMALLQQQQENFKGFVQLILDSTNSRLETIVKDIQEVKVTCNSHRKRWMT